MELYVKRMISERDELKGRIKKAKETLEKKPFRMNARQEAMLSSQVEHMERYLDVLERRIEYEGA